MTIETVRITSSTDVFTPVNATIDVDTQFSTDLVGGVPNTCQKIIQAANTSGSKANFLNIYKVDQIKTNLSAFNTKIAALNPGLTISGNLDDINEYLTSLEKTQIPVQKLVAACLSEKVAPDTTKLDVSKRDYETSKARYESVTEQTTSYYEGWFPLYRPVKEQSLFILFGISILFLLVACLLFLSQSDIYLKIELPRQYDMPYMQFDYTYVTWGVSGLILGLIVAAIAIYVKWV